MQRSLSRWSLVLWAIPLLLVSVPALAGPGADACNLLASGNCKFVTTPATCAAQCTPPSFIAECDGECTAGASASCTGTCGASCMAACTASPGTFNCAAACASDCQASCTTLCSGQPASCASDCMLDCPNRCGIQCTAVPPMANCAAQCQASCNASCQVQANMACHVNCAASVAPGECTIDCQAPNGAVFCGTPPQYVDLAKAASDCVMYLQSQGITANTTCTVGKGCTTSSSGCSATPARSAGGSSWSALAVAGLMLGLGLASRRRRLA